MNLIKSRVYPVNVDTHEVYIGKYDDGKFGFPTIQDCFEQWHGTSIVGLYGKHIRHPEKWHYTARSIFPMEEEKK